MRLVLHQGVECCGKSIELEVRRLEVPALGLWKSLQVLEPGLTYSFVRYEGEELSRYLKLYQPVVLRT